jgi:Tol biopolymer transport system component
VAAILASEPQPISVVQPMSPPALDRVVRACLAKDPDERFQTVHDLKLQLKWIAEGGSQAGLPAPVAVRRKNRERWLIAAVAVCGLLAVAGLVGTWRYWRKAEGLHRTIRAQISPPEHYSFTESGFSNHVVISPDSSRIAFIAQGETKQLLWVQRLDGALAQPVAGSEGAIYPFWSADSQYVGFFAGGKLKKVEVNAGVVQVLCDAPFGRGGTWNRDGVILFAPGIHDLIYKISDGGGTPAPVTKFANPGPLAGNRWPYFLPDGRHFLYVDTDPQASRGRIYVASLESPDAKQVAAENSNAEYAAGRLFFVKDGNLVTQAFNLGRLELEGSSMPIFAGVEYTDTRALGNFSVSQSGVLVARPAFSQASQLIWLDREGRRLAKVGEPGHFMFARLSPDDRSVLLSRDDDSERTKSDVWLMDVQRGISSRLTFARGIQRSGIWAPDSRHLLVSGLGAKAQILSAAGNGVPVTLEPIITRGQDWSPDGRTLLVAQQNSNTGWDILSIPSSGEQTLTPVLTSSFDEHGARFSPDGHWLAYLSNESGRYEVYVIPFPGPGGRWQLSNGGGAVGYWPVWSRDGRRIYYRDPNGVFMVVDVEAKGSEFHPGTARQFFSNPGGAYPAGVAADGRVLVQVPAETEAPPPLTLIVNWDAEKRN